MANFPQKDQPHPAHQQPGYEIMPQKPGYVPGYNPEVYQMPVMNQPIRSSGVTTPLPPVWRDWCCFVKELQIPRSSYNSLIASGRIMCCPNNIQYDNCRFDKRAPVLESAHYELEWQENSSLSGRITQPELQRFCDEAAEYCKKDIDKSRYLMRGIQFGAPSIIFLFMLVFYIIAEVTGQYVLVIIAIIGVIIVALITFYYNVTFKNFPLKVQGSLVAFIDSKKQQLLSRGINPIPGPFGVYMEFKSLT